MRVGRGRTATVAGLVRILQAHQHKRGRVAVNAVGELIPRRQRRSREQDPRHSQQIPAGAIRWVTGIAPREPSTPPDVRFSASGG